jgi:hypothetical protein
MLLMLLPNDLHEQPLAPLAVEFIVGILGTEW